MEPVTGIGPAYPPWKGGVLPLNYTDVVPNQNFTGATIADGVLRDAVIFRKEVLMNFTTGMGNSPMQSTPGQTVLLRCAITHKRNGLSLCLPKYSFIN